MSDFFCRIFATTLLTIKSTDMKKLLLSFITLFLLIPITAVSDDNDKTEDPIRRIHIIILRRQQRVPAQEEEIDITYYAAERIIEMDFNENIGRIFVSVTGEGGKEIYGHYHFTDLERGCDIMLPPTDMTYTIHITGDEYESIAYIYL